MSMSTRPDPERSGTVEIATRRRPRLRIVWDLRELTRQQKPRLWSLPARLGPVTVHPTRWAVASQQGHLAARGSSIPRKRRPIDTSSEAGTIRAESTGLALRQATAPGLDQLRGWALARSLVSIPPNTSFEPDGPASSGSWSREATYRWYRTRFTCCPSC